MSVLHGSPISRIEFGQRKQPADNPILRFFVAGGNAESDTPRRCAVNADQPGDRGVQLPESRLRDALLGVRP
jgi:hypothetical protein